LVRTAGLEPAQGYPQGILSPLRLPFRHVRESGHLYDAEKADNHTRSADAHNYTMSAKANNYITSAKAIIREPTITRHPREANIDQVSADIDHSMSTECQIRATNRRALLVQ
jgi:hypothetical protein